MKWNLKMALGLFLAAGLAGTGCLKDKDYDDGIIQSLRATDGTVKVVEIKLSASSTDNFFPFFVDNSPNDTTVDLIPINLATHDPAPKDLHITLTRNDQLVTDYNAANTDTTVTATNPDPTGAVTHYDIPNGLYTVVNPVVIIPKGQHTAYLQVKFKPSDLVGDKKYAVGFSITKIDEPGYTISGNTKDAIVVIGIKNKYDGLYSLTVRTVGWAAYGISDGPTKKWPSNASFESTGANSLVLHTKEGGIGVPAFDATGAPTSFGSTEARFTFDLSTNALTAVDNTVGDDGRGRTFFLNTAEQSRYDPTSQTIYAAFVMTQNGRPNQFFYDTLVYQGPR